jgi:nicotinamidase-related amidase
MTLFRTVLLTSALVLALSSGAHAQRGAQDTPASGAASKPMVTLQMPALPDPVPVTLNPKTTALVLFDFIDTFCASQPKCKGGMLSAMTPFLARARKAGVVVAYGTLAENMSKWLPDVAPQPGDIKIVNTAQDRFYNTDLDQALKAKGITTVVMGGWKVSGSVAYSSVGATLRGYTVVVPVDTTAATDEYEQIIGFYNILNQRNGNMTNQPLKPDAPTLSRTDMITFQ